MSTVNAITADLAGTARAYVLDGKPVFPVKPRDKAPATGRGFHDASALYTQVDKWWGQNPQYNIGMPIPAGHVCIDVDRNHDGLTKWAQMVAERGGLPRTWEADTGGGGKHYVFRTTVEEFEGRICPGVDIRAGGRHYIVVAPSIHKSGNQYRWVTPPSEPAAQAPAWLELLIAKGRQREKASAAAQPADQRESIADQYSATAKWTAILEPHGWVVVQGDGDEHGSRWRRPGADSESSASILYDQSATPLLHVFSTSAEPFDADRTYTRFAAYALLNHGGDQSAAAKALRPATDYGRTDFDPVVLHETTADGQPTPDAANALDNAIRNRAAQIRIDRAAKELVDAEQRPKIEYPPVRSLTALLAQPCPPTRWRIDQAAPIEARTILSAQFKAGKTTATGNLVRSLVDREPFLGRFAITQPAEALVLIDDELSEYMVQDWLGRQNIRNTDAVADVVTLRGKLASFNLFDDDCRAAWAKRFRDLGCDYLILDCLRPVLDAFGLDENRDAGVFLVQFDAMLEAAGIRDALLVHHMGHSGERSRGDSRLQDWPDVNWRLVREDADDPSSARFFSAYGRDVSIPEGRLRFSETTRHLTYVDGSRGDTKTEAALQAVLAALVADARAGGGGLSGRAIEIAVSDEHTQKSIRAAVKLAHQRELLVKMPGPKNATLHRIAHPCAVCGYPLTAGQGMRHESCVEEVAA